MLLQTNSYIVPREKRVEHARLLRRFRQILLRLGCDHFEVYEQTGANWSSGDNAGRFVQIMRFRDRKQQLAVQQAETNDPSAQAVLKEFCDLINLPYQQQQGLFAVGFYTSFMRMPEVQHQAGPHAEPADEQPAPGEVDQTHHTDAAGNGENLAAHEHETIHIPEISRAAAVGEENQPSEEAAISKDPPVNGDEAIPEEDPIHDEEPADDSIPDGLDLNPDEKIGRGADAASLDPQSAFQSEEEADLQDHGELPNVGDNENEQAENPTFPSSS